MTKEVKAKKTATKKKADTYVKGGPNDPVKLAFEAAYESIMRSKKENAAKK